MTGYDIVGDIHGHADKLERLLWKLGYRDMGSGWQHPERQAIFVGDFIDRGPEQVRTVTIARRMVERGAALAVMGNHELNAIAWHTPDPKNPDDFLRSHHSPKYGAKNRAQHRAFLDEVEREPALHADLIDWFLTLPLWLDLPELSVVHACWHPTVMAWLAPGLKAGRFLTRELMVVATDRPENESDMDNATPSIFKAVEWLTKGIEVPLPPPHTFKDKDGHERNRVRVRWWDRDAATFRSAAMLAEDERRTFPEDPLPPHTRVEPAGRPVFFGHYWLTGLPALQSARVACLDYSAGKGGPLVAYRFNFERELNEAGLVWVD